MAGPKRDEKKKKKENRVTLAEPSQPRSALINQNPADLQMQKRHLTTAIYSHRILEGLVCGTS